MLVTRTPFRVTLGGGGTDLPSYYEEHGGFIFAMGLDKYMYIMMNRPLVDKKVRLHYTQSEVVDSISELKHELAREALRYLGVENQVELSSLADFPAGTGLGSSSCYLVGLLCAIRAYLRKPISLQNVAEEACKIELEILKKPIGKQDQYMAAFGGLSVLEIEKNGKVEVKQIDLPPGAIEEFLANTHIYYTGVQRDALDVLKDQDSAAKNKTERTHDVVVQSLHNIKSLGRDILSSMQACNFDEFGRLLNEHWENKKRMSSKISLSKVDELYSHVRSKYNVLGGKIIGAGGGGFLMLYCQSGQRELTEFMASQGMFRLHYNIDFDGVRVVSNFKASINQRS